MLRSASRRWLLRCLAACLALAGGCDPGEQAGDVVQLQLALDQPAEPDPFGRGGSTYKVAGLKLMGTAGGVVVFSEVVDFDQSAEGLTTLQIPEITGARGELSFPIADVTLTLNGYNGSGELVSQGVSQPVDLVLGLPVDASMLFTRLDTCSKLGVSMTRARWGHTATLTDQGTVLVFGGAASIVDGAPGTKPAEPGVYEILAEPELYDPQAGTIESLPITGLAARMFHTAIRVANGVLIAGGLGEDGAPVNSAVLYDTVRNAVTSQYSLEKPRAAHAVAEHQDGIFFGGGLVSTTGAGIGAMPGLVQLPGGGGALEATASAEVLDLTGDSSGEIDDLPGGARAFPVAVNFQGTSIVVAGGLGPARPSGAVDWYPDGGMAETIHTLATPRLLAAAYSNDAGSAMVVGGTDASGASLADGVSLAPGAADGDAPVVTAAPAMDVERSGFGIAALASGKLVALAGLAESQLQTRFASYAEVYDGEAFVTTGALRVPRGFGTVTALSDGRVVVIGGLALDQDSGETEVLDSIELYVTARDLP